MPILNDKLLKAVKGRMPKEGFRKNFWQGNRARAANGSGVGKALEQMEMYGVTPGGSADNVGVEHLEAVIRLYDTLTKAMKTAKGKCGKAQSHTSEMCDAYLKLIPKLKAEAEKRLNAGAKPDEAKEKPVIEEEQAPPRVSPEQEKKARELAAFKKAADPIAKELDNAIKLATDMHAASDTTNREISKIHNDWMSKNQPGTENASALTKAALTSISNAMKQNDFKHIGPTVKQLQFDAKNLQTQIKALGKPAGAEKDLKALVVKLSTLAEKQKIAAGSTVSATNTYNYVVSELKSSVMEGT